MITTLVAVVDGDLLNTSKLVDYDFVGSFALRANSVSCSIDGTTVNETDDTDIDIGTDGVTITPSYTVTAGDISNSATGTVFLKITARQTGSSGTVIATDADSSSIAASISPSITIANSDLKSGRAYVEVEITDISPA